MSAYLWKYYLEDDVDRFRHVLASAAHTGRPSTQRGVSGKQTGGFSAPLNSSPGSFSPSPFLSAKNRKFGGPLSSLSRSDVNSRDAAGLTLLHHAASSSSDSSVLFAQALLEHPWTDLYIQDAENAWTPLHRAFYFGNIAIARLILNRDAQDILGHGSAGFNHNARGLVKIKDKEGYGPLDLFAMTIKDRTLQAEESPTTNDDSDDDMARGDSGDVSDEARKCLIAPSVLLKGDEVFTFGSNKNVTLGFGDEDDRQFPERILLRRPDHLLQRFYQEYQQQNKQQWLSMGLNPLETTVHLPIGTVELPVHIRNIPIVIQDVQMSKLHTAILTTDPIANLYMCGHGPGGRLGTGSETTRYQFTCIEGGGLGQRKVATVALGQNHTLAVTDEGEIYSWGNNAFGQLGYALPKPALKDEDPISTYPRQIFGPLKRELVVGIAASRIHSVVHTATSLYTFGKNEGQLGIVDSDARSLEAQVIPRKIAAALFSSPINSVSAIDSASICLLENREVWVFANYGFAKLVFPLDGFASNFLKESWLTTKYDAAPNKIRKITSGGNTICAMSTSGEVFTVSVSRRAEASQDSNTSTTNPKQIRGALSTPYRIWSSNKSHMAARDVDVDQDGSIILTTDAGSVWRRTKRATIKNANSVGPVDTKPKDYKFLRVPGLTRVIAVRASAYGAYAAIRKDCDVTKMQIGVDESTLWSDFAPLLPFHDLTEYEEQSDDEDPSPRFWTKSSTTQNLRKRVLKADDLEKEVQSTLLRSSTFNATYDLEIRTTTSDVALPLHEFIFAGRSHVFRDAMSKFRADGTVLTVSELMSIKQDTGGKIQVLFHGLDFLAIFNLVLYLYTDALVDFWNVTRRFPTQAFRFRSVRTELMKVATRLDLKMLEPAVRQMVDPRKSLNLDMEFAIKSSSFFATGDVIIDLADGDMLLHSDVICQRCPFFEGLFKGRAGGQWLADRRADSSSLVHIDLTHIEVSLFRLIVRYLYTDAGEELFEDITSEDLNDLLALDELLDHVMDIMSVANELMLDRLTQICQKLIGRYVNARNVCSLLTAIAPSSVAEFKDAALEYVCLSLEAVMQNGSLEELDEDLLLELNQVVHENQLAYLPFARSGRAESLLFDKYPDLVEKIEQGRRAKIDAIVLSAKHADGDHASPFRAHSFDEGGASPLRQRTRRRASKDPKSPTITPALRSRGSAHDLMFNMSDGEDEEAEKTGRIRQPRFDKPSQDNDAYESPLGSPEGPWSASHLRSRPDMDASEAVLVKSTSPLPPPAFQQSRTPDRPWGAAPLPSTKLDLKDIMSQASSSRPSNLTLGFSRTDSENKHVGLAHVKTSQKERKRQQQAQVLGAQIEKPQPAAPTVSPWQAMSQRKISNSPIIGTTTQASPKPGSPPSRTPSTPQLNMRQTIANNGPSKQKDNRQGASKDKVKDKSSARPAASERGMSVSTTPIPTPHSVRHILPPSHSPTSPSTHLSMLEILSLQEAEKTSIRDAAAKRSLEEIQQEQEFQAWWDQESQRVMREEEARKRAEERALRASIGRGRGGTRGRGRGKAKGKSAEEGRGKESRDVGAAVVATGDAAPAKGGRSEGSERGRGRGRGGGQRGGREGKAGRAQVTGGTAHTGSASNAPSLAAGPPQ